jgi:hypothetical protein
VKEMCEEYEKEVERRGKGETVKGKVDKISLFCFLQIELMLSEDEEEERRKFVKNNLLPVLPFLLCGEEKEGEEEDSDGEEIRNAIVFYFFCDDRLLQNDSLRFVLLSDERKVFLLKTLFFCLRRDAPLTRRECLNVLEIVFNHGRE